MFILEDNIANLKFISVSLCRNKKLMFAKDNLITMPWKEVPEEEFRRIGRKRRGSGRKRRWKTAQIYKDLIQLRPGAAVTITVEEFCNMYGLDLSGMSNKQIKKSLRGRLRTAMKKGIIDEFATVGNIIKVKRSEIPTEDLMEEYAYLIEGGLEELEELEEE